MEQERQRTDAVSPLWAARAQPASPPCPCHGQERRGCVHSSRPHCGGFISGACEPQNFWAPELGLNTLHCARQHHGHSSGGAQAGSGDAGRDTRAGAQRHAGVWGLVVTTFVHVSSVSPIRSHTEKVSWGDRENKTSQIQREEKQGCFHSPRPCHVHLMKRK